MWTPKWYIFHVIYLPRDYFFSVLATFSIEDCSLWYVRFCLNSQKSKLALGNQIGQIYVYELGSECEEYKIPGIILRHPQCTQVIRQTAFSRDGHLIVAVCDDGTVWRWDSTNRKRNVDFYWFSLCRQWLGFFKWTVIYDTQLFVWI